MKRLLVILLLAIGALVLVFFGLVWWLNYFPAQKMAAELACPAQVKPSTLKAKTKIRLLSWNIQYGASRKHHFFYDGGKDVYATKENVASTLQAINEVVKKYDPDIILWQELDRNSTRTGYIDQLKHIWDARPYACYSAAPYHKSAYLPHPSHQHLKRVDMQLGVFSRYPIQRAIRYQLPMLKESFFRRAFNLKRAILEVEIPVEGDKPLVLLNTHFSAFSYGDGTLDGQVAAFLALAQAAERAGSPWVAAGDLNLLPPGDDPGRLGKEESKYYADKKNPIDPLFASLTSALPLDLYKKSPDKYNTYLPFGTKKTDRWIDHAFVGKRLKVERYEVLPYLDISDHMPILIEFQIQ